MGDALLIIFFLANLGIEEAMLGISWHATSKDLDPTRDSPQPS
jgi:hypothetical protein